MASRDDQQAAAGLVGAVKTTAYIAVGNTLLEFIVNLALTLFKAGTGAALI